MGEALLAALEEILKDTITEPIKEAWMETYNALSEDMIRAMVKEGRRASSS